MKVALDDERNFTNVDVVVRTPDAFRGLFRNSGVIEILYLDHDLGFEYPTGYDMLCSMFSWGLYPKKVVPVTNNPPGRERIIAALENVGYQKVLGYWIFPSPDEGEIE